MSDVVDWLLDGDPAIRWQVRRDLLDDPEGAGTERRRVAHEGWGARILGLQRPDGSWAGGAHFPDDFSEEEWRRDGQAWSSTSHALMELRALGVDPGDPRVRDAVEGVARSVVWEHAGQRYFDGEVEPCINGQAVAIGAYFGRDMSPVVSRLLDERLADGGWNCDVERGSVVSSLDTTMCVLEGLGEHGATRGWMPGVEEAVDGGLEYLLERGLFRGRRSGAVIDPSYLDLAFPYRFHHSTLRALDWMRAMDRDRDPRCGEAIDALRAKRSVDGTWRLERTWKGRRTVEMESSGAPSRWITLIASRVLRWWDSA